MSLKPSQHIASQEAQPTTIAEFLASVKDELTQELMQQLNHRFRQWREEEKTRANQRHKAMMAAIWDLRLQISTSFQTQTIHQPMKNPSMPNSPDPFLFHHNKQSSSSKIIPNPTDPSNYYPTNQSSSLDANPSIPKKKETPPEPIPSKTTSSTIDLLDQKLATQTKILQQIKHNLSKTHHHMQQYTNKIKDTEFKKNEFPSQYLQSICFGVLGQTGVAFSQTSIKHRASKKLSRIYFGPFQVTKRIGPIDYELSLPPSRVHPAFHVSLLQQSPGETTEKVLLLPSTFSEPLELETEKYLGKRAVLREEKKVWNYLIKWMGRPSEEATWKDKAKVLVTCPALGEAEAFLSSSCIPIEINPYLQSDKVVHVGLAHEDNFEPKKAGEMNVVPVTSNFSNQASISDQSQKRMSAKKQQQQLRLGKNGEFKILQVADMHYADGKSTSCLNVLPSQDSTCSDLNTTAFIKRMIQAENPDFIVFTGDNIFGSDATDPVKSMNAAFAPAIASGIPWAAILGNHDQESTLSREGVMKHIVTLNHTLSKKNPPEAEVIDGFGNYNLEVRGVKGSTFENKSVLNLYFLDSGDYSKVPSIRGYDWIKPSQQFWFQQTSAKLKQAYMTKPYPQKEAAPGLAYFHIPLPEFASFDSSNFTGVRQEGIGSASVNSGFFTTMVASGDVKAVFVGHDHINDFCGQLTGIQLCYAGGFGYHAYGKAGWERRARVVVASLEKTQKGGWGAVSLIKTWKRLDDRNLTAIEELVLFRKISAGSRRKKQISGAWKP